MLSENIKRLRKERGWTQTELAKKIGVSQGVIASIENEGRSTSKHAPALASVFGLTIGQLLEEHEVDKVEPIVLGEDYIRLAKTAAICGLTTEQVNKMIGNIMNDAGITA